MGLGANVNGTMYSVMEFAILRRNGICNEAALYRYQSEKGDLSILRVLDIQIISTTRSRSAAISKKFLYPGDSVDAASDAGASDSFLNLRSKRAEISLSRPSMKFTSALSLELPGTSAVERGVGRGEPIYDEVEGGGEGMTDGKMKPPELICDAMKALSFLMLDS